MEIRPIDKADAEAVWQIWQEVVQEGDAFYSDESVPREKVIAMWVSGDSWVTVLGGQVVGAYGIFPVGHGRRAHVADGCYMVARAFRRKGIGRAMGQDSLQKARDRSFLAMQFDCVVSTNRAAVTLWEKLGFVVCGRVPKAFLHPRLGLVDTLIMHRFL
jgi:L-amino acid N-acyltransferase YncA